MMALLKSEQGDTEMVTTVRELDPKLLLACVAAERGFSSVIGSRREMEFNIDAFPRSIYLSKSMTIRSLLFFQVAQHFP